MLPKAGRAQVVARCREFGLRLVDDGSTISVDINGRFVFTRCGLHYLDLDYGPDAFRTKADVWAMVMDDIRGGLVPCAVPDCDVCGEASDAPAWPSGHVLVDWPAAVSP